MKKTELFIGLLAIFLFITLVGRYFYVDFIEESISSKFYNSKKWIEYNIVSCKENQIKIKVSDGYLCREESEPSIFLQIYDTYPRSNNGKEIVYKFLDEGEIEVADRYLDNFIVVDRYDPIKLEKQITWEEDPYGERYWRFLFYSLRPTRDLLYAGRVKNNQTYNHKLIEITEGFIDNGMDKPHAWDDKNGVAFRTMVLTNTWWKLREQNALPIETSTKILNALQEHGEFLAEDKNYEEGFNHGINEATALLVLSENFPDVDGADEWNAIAKSRLNKGLNHLIDKDGVLIENSPYYHFYVMEKYWQIYEYSKEHNINISEDLENKIKLMTSYGSFVLQPNLKTPTIGASLYREINLAGEFKEISKIDSHFLYVLTMGKEGEVPKEINKYYPTAGQTIMRSGWGKGEEFKDQTQIIFDVGPYRTQHSDLDALSFSLYSNDFNLITDSGLYTYEENLYKDYFHGTFGHNTIVVDDLDQEMGAAIPGTFFEEGGYVYQSAQHDLYKGVSHQRAVMLIEKDLVLIVDDLVSDSQHNYKQLFHIFPEAELTIDGLTVKGTGETREQSITIHQLLANGLEVNVIKGQENPPRGLCSYEYGVLIPCYTVTYEKKGSTVRYITLLEIGEQDKELSFNFEDSANKILINKGQKEYSVVISKSLKFDREIIITNKEIIPTNTQEKEGAVIIIFDDGYSSISYASEIMKGYNLRGNIAAIGKYIDQNKGYLSLEELKGLQDNYQWNIVSHSWNHVNGVSEYSEKNNLGDFEEDILKELKYLIDNEINSVPNWYIYPHGATNTEIKDVIGKYYKFARITESANESDIFNDPLAIKAFSVTDTTSPEEVGKEISNAKENNLTLFLTFHRIKLLPGEEAGYYIKDFEKIVEDISNKGIKVKTLSELDRDNGITQNKLIIKEEIPEQIILDITSKEKLSKIGILSKILNYVR